MGMIPIHTLLKSVQTHIFPIHVGEKLTLAFFMHPKSSEAGCKLFVKN